MPNCIHYIMFFKICQLCKNEIPSDNPRGYLSYHDMQKVKKDSDDGTGEEDCCKDKEIVLHTLIDTEKHKESDTGIGDESREHSTRRNDTVKEKLGDYDGRSTIWNKSDQGGYERRENACVCRKIRNSVFTDPMDAETDDKREEKDKECNLHRMENCGEKNPLMTMAIFILADSRDLFFAIGSFFEAQKYNYSSTSANFDTKNPLFSPLVVSLSAILSVKTQKKLLAQDLLYIRRATRHKNRKKPEST